MILYFPSGLVIYCCNNELLKIQQLGKKPQIYYLAFFKVKFQHGSHWTEIHVLARLGSPF